MLGGHVFKLWMRFLLLIPEWIVYVSIIKVSSNKTLGEHIHASIFKCFSNIFDLESMDSTGSSISSSEAFFRVRVIIPSFYGNGVSFFWLWLLFITFVWRNVNAVLTTWEAGSQFSVVKQWLLFVQCGFNFGPITNLKYFYSSILSVFEANT